MKVNWRKLIVGVVFIGISTAIIRFLKIAESLQEMAWVVGILAVNFLLAGFGVFMGKQRFEDIEEVTKQLAKGDLSSADKLAANEDRRLAP